MKALKKNHTHWLLWIVSVAIILGSAILYASNSSLFSSIPQAQALSTPPTGKTWNLILSEEFNGSALDTTRWKAYHNTYGDGNQEEACLTPNNVAVSGGTLKITAKRENVACPGQPVDNFTSGFIASREKGIYYPVFSRYEIRAKLPHGQGLWPAFWLRHSAGSSTAEVDVMEYFHASSPGTTSQTLHFPAEISYNTSKVSTAFEAPTSTPDWHTWAVEILPVNNDYSKATIIFYQDGIKRHQYTPTKFGWLNNYNKDAMFDIAINLAVGGKWVGHPDDDLAYSRYLGKCLKPQNGTPPCNSTNVRRATFAATYEVDYVRVHTLADAPQQPQPPAPTEPSTPVPSSPAPTPQQPQQSPKPSSTTTKPASDTPAPTANKEKTCDEQACKPVTTSPEQQRKNPLVSLSPQINSPAHAATVKKVEYIVDGTVIQTDTDPPFEFNTALLTRSSRVTEKVHYISGDINETTRLVEVKQDAPLRILLIPVIAIVATTGIAIFFIKKKLIK